MNFFINFLYLGTIANFLSKIPKTILLMFLLGQ